MGHGPGRAAEEWAGVTASEFGLRSAVDRFLAAQPVYPCGVLAHLTISRLEQVAGLLAAWYGRPPLSLGEWMSRALLPVAAADWPYAARAALLEAIQGQPAGVVVCTHIDILFEPRLMLNPLRLLLDMSRVAPLLVLWPGEAAHGLLHYTGSDGRHAHHRAWPVTDLCPVCVIVL
jgi:hypothetical protein